MPVNRTTRRRFLQRSAAALTAVAASPLATAPLAARPNPAVNAPSAPQGDWNQLSLEEVATLLQKKKVSPVELTQASLDRIAQIDARIGAFLHVATEQALAAARTAESEIQKGRYRDPLHGIPIGLKDTNYTRAFLRQPAAASSRVSSPAMTQR
jgi:amidase